MRHSRLRWALGATAAALPASAQANAGIGLLSPGALMAIPALIPAIFIEAVVLGRMLGLGYPRALWISFLANVFSTVAGGAIGIGLDIAMGGGGPEPGRGLFLTSLVPMFFLTWWLERFVVRRRVPDDVKPRATRATFAANLLTYALMAVAIWFLIPPAGERADRWRISEGVIAMYAAKEGIEENFRSTGAFPAPRSLGPTKGNLRSMSLEEGGRIVGVFSFPRSPDADGKRVMLEPRVEEKKIVEWVCYTSDMPHKYLPANCRQQPPPGK